MTWVNDRKFHKLLNEAQVGNISELFSGEDLQARLTPRTGGRRGNRSKWPRE